MKKNELKSGMIVEFRDGGNKRLVVGDHLIGEKGFSRLSHYDDDLKRTIGNNINRLDIIKVYKYKSVGNFSELFEDDNLDLIWERKEKELDKWQLEHMKPIVRI